MNVCHTVNTVSLRNTKQGLAIFSSHAEINTGAMTMGFWISVIQWALALEPKTLVHWSQKHTSGTCSTCRNCHWSFRGKINGTKMTS